MNPQVCPFPPNGLMTRPQPNLSERARGTLLGVAVGLGCGENPVPDPVERMLILAEELRDDPVDLGRVARRWVEWYLGESTRGSVAAGTSAGLAFLARWHAPPRDNAPDPDSAALVVALPVALAARNSPSSLVSGVYHVASLTHPDPATAWAAVAVGVAAARFLAGHRDFLGDVIAALQANDAPDEVLSALRRIPLRQAVESAGHDTLAPIPCLEVGLGILYQFGQARGVLRWLESVGPPPMVGAVVLGLCGARDGEQSLPAMRVARLGEAARIRTLAKRLVAPREGRG